MARTIFTALEMGGGGGDGGTPLYATNDLWLELVSTSILSPTNLSATLLVHTPEVLGVYDLFFKTGLSPSNAWYWVARGLPGQTNFYLVNLPVDGGFFILGTTNFTDTNGLTAAYRGLVGGTSTLTNDFDHDGLPDAWEILNFGDLSQSAVGDYDGDGLSNLYAYQHSREPNVIAFSLDFGNLNINANTATGNVIVSKGVPASMAVLVNSTNFNSALWQPYNPSILASLGTNDGDYDVWIGLRGRLGTSQQTWIGTTITHDTVPPRIVVTSPSTSTLSRSIIQLQGYVSEGLSRLTYDLSNASGVVANQAGFVTGAHPDTNIWKFTTNYFQCYDVTLTNGPNTITLHATDLAGNGSTTNITFILDYSSDTNAPTATIHWPTANALVSGTNFVLSGTVDEDAVSVIASDGSNAFPAVLERGGRFSVPGLPLAGPTNAFTITMTDEAGNSSTQSLTVRQSAIALIINPVSASQLTGALISLSGSISDSSQQVWADGYPAAVSNGVWSAIIPAPDGGSASVIVQAGPDQSDLVAEQSANITMPSRVQAMSCLRRYSRLEVDESDSYVYEYVNREEQSWEPGTGGRSETYESEADGFVPPWPPPLNQYESTLVGWPGYWPDGLTFDGVDIYNGGPPQDYTETAALPWQFCQRSEYKLGLPGTGTSTIISSLVRTPLELTVGGPANTGEQRLIRLTVTAAGYSGSLLDRPFHAPGDIPEPATNIMVFGEPVTPTATNDYVGEVWVAAAAGSQQELRISVTGANSQIYSVGAKAEDYGLSITANGVTLDPQRVVTNANFIVGQRLTFSTNWAKMPFGFASKSVQWSFEGHFLNDSNQPGPDYSVNYTTNFAKLTNDTTAAWWVSGANPAVTYIARLTETLKLNNGSFVTNSAQGLFSVLRPLPTFTAQIREIVRVDTNWFFSSDHQTRRPGTNMHFGVASSITNEGIAFVYTNAPLKPGTTETYGTYSLPQVIEMWRQRYNLRDGTNCTGYQAEGGGGLDGSYNSLGPASQGSQSPIDSWADSPGAALSEASWLSHTNSFSTYLMFQPLPYTNSVPVPMYKVQWYWFGTATNGPPWGKASGLASNGLVSPTEDYPRWTNIITELDSAPAHSTTNNCFNEN